jgi:hypothetical protein
MLLSVQNEVIKELKIHKQMHMKCMKERLVCTRLQLELLMKLLSLQIRRGSFLVS